MKLEARIRRRAIITGAAGGMGQACARSFGETMDLVLSDIAEARLDAFAASLETEGYGVAAVIAGNLRDKDVTGRLAHEVSGSGGLGAVIHTAAISQGMAAWDRILEVNLIGTIHLLDALEPHVQDGSVGVMIASMAGHLVPVLAEVDALLDDPLAPDVTARFGEIVANLAKQDGRSSSQIAYGLSKGMVMRLCERRAPRWATSGGRIVSISPGMIYTPMGRAEVEGNPFAGAVVDATPAGRWGRASDIAAAARFLASDAASFVTGTDLRVDGGVTPVMLAKLADRTR